ncbi:Beta-1,3-galactosyltransferase 1, partial [Orchesella cincta]
MHSLKVQEKPRSIGRAYAGDLLVQIAQHEDHDDKQYGYMFASSPQESPVYSPSPTLTREDIWPSRTRSRVLDSESPFPPVFFPRNSKRSSKPYSPPGSSPVKVSLGFRIFQITSILIVGICMYALVENILFLVKSYGDDSYQDESKRSSVNIHEQLQSWIIHGEEELSILPQMSSGGNHIISSPVSGSPSEIGHKPKEINHAMVSTHNLTFIHNASSVCSSVRTKSQGRLNSLSSSSGATGEGIYFMIVVHSAPDHFTERQAIRSTWASVKTLKNLAIRTVFVLGKYQLSPSPTLENSIRRENELFGDIVVGDFIDCYRNLTYKHLLGYKWINKYCPGATFILKTDDDAFVDIFQLFDFISRTYGFAPKPGTLICNVFPEGTKPVRAKKARGSKWSVTMDEYPHSVYPRYCGGLAYLATGDVVARILDVSDRVKFFWIDDVFVTGILRELAEIEPFYLNLRYLYDPEEYRNWLLPAGTLPNDNNNSNSDNEDKKSQQRLRKFPFLFAHIERGDKFSEEMNDLWRKTLRSWSQ